MGTHYDYATIKYRAPIEVEEVIAELQNDKLEVIPNPCYGVGLIEYYLRIKAQVKFI
ncbi:MAG: hypothetical protein ACUVQT_10650 [bacterium]